MKVTKDGSVVRIALDSSIGSVETRISFAVNSHGDMVRPRIELSEKALKELIMRVLPHVSGTTLVNDDYDLSYVDTVFGELVRITSEAVIARPMLQRHAQKNTSQSAIPGKGFMGEVG